MLCIADTSYALCHAHPRLADIVYHSLIVQRRRRCRPRASWSSNDSDADVSPRLTLRITRIVNAASYSTMALDCTLSNNVVPRAHQQPSITACPPMLTHPTLHYRPVSSITS